MNLTDAVSRRARAAGPVGPMEARVVAAPGSPSALLRVEVDAQRGLVRSCPWMPRPDATPAAGDQALVVESDAGALWVIAWWPDDSEEGS